MKEKDVYARVLTSWWRMLSPFGRKVDEGSYATWRKSFDRAERASQRRISLDMVWRVLCR